MYERMKIYHGQPLHVWRMDFAAYNESGRWLVRFSRQVGRNLGPIFETWGVPTSQAARDSIDDLPRPETLPVILKDPSESAFADGNRLSESGAAPPARIPPG